MMKKHIIFALLICFAIFCFISCDEEPDQFTITASAGSNGSIVPSGETDVDEGDNQTFIITPDSDYRIEDVLVDGTSAGALTSYAFTNMTGDHTINVTFEPDDIGTFTENFDDGEANHFFDDESGKWIVADGTYQLTVQNDDIWCYSYYDHLFTDFIYTLDIVQTAGNDGHA